MSIRLSRLFCGLFLAGWFALLPVLPTVAQDAAGGSETEAVDLDNRIVLELEGGLVTIDLRPDMAPSHVARLKNLIRRDFYDGLLFHRVIDGFVAQTGDPTGTGMGGSDLPDLEAEISDGQFLRGTVGMARGEQLDSANSQFFILLGDAPWLEGEHTIIGQVVSGLELIESLKSGTKPDNGLVKNPDAMVALRIVGDVDQRLKMARQNNAAAELAAERAQVATAAAVSALQEADTVGRYAEESRQAATLADEAVARKTAAEEQASFAVQDAEIAVREAEASLSLTRNQLSRATQRLDSAVIQVAELSQIKQATSTQRAEADAQFTTAQAQLGSAEDAFAAASDASDKAAERAQRSRQAAEQASAGVVAARQVLVAIKLDQANADQFAATTGLASSIARETRTAEKVAIETQDAATARQLFRAAEAVLQANVSDANSVKGPAERATAVAGEAKRNLTDAEMRLESARSLLAEASIAKPGRQPTLRHCLWRNVMFAKPSRHSRR